MASEKEINNISGSGCHSYTCNKGSFPWIGMSQWLCAAMTGARPTRLPNLALFWWQVEVATMKIMLKAYKEPPQEGGFCPHHALRCFWPFMKSPIQSAGKFHLGKWVDWVVLKRERKTNANVWFFFGSAFSDNRHNSFLTRFWPIDAIRLYPLLLNQTQSTGIWTI